MVNKGVVLIGDGSGNLAGITSDSKLKVDASVTATANISGQPVNISGNTVIALISGQTVVASVNVAANVAEIKFKRISPVLKAVHTLLTLTRILNFTQIPVLA